MAEEILDVFFDLSLIEPDPPEVRGFCYRCSRPLKACWCQYLPKERFNIRTSVYILQHPYEETRSLRTAIMLTLGLPEGQCQTIKGKRFPQKRYPELHELAALENSLLLYPGANSVDLRDLVQHCHHTCNNGNIYDEENYNNLTNPRANNIPDQVGEKGNSTANSRMNSLTNKLAESCNSVANSVEENCNNLTNPMANSLTNSVVENCNSLASLQPHKSYNLFVLDGTWIQAKGIFHQNQFLHDMRQVKLTSTEVSKYVVRTQPTYTSLSTVETVALAIQILEQHPTIYQELVRPLEALCNYQLDHGAVRHHSKQYLKDHGLYKKQVNVNKPPGGLCKRARQRLRKRLAAAAVAAATATDEDAQQPAAQPR